MQEIKNQSSKNEASIANINHEIETANSQLIEKIASSEILKAKLKLLESEEALIQREIEDETAKLLEARKIMDTYASECNEQKLSIDKANNERAQVPNQIKSLEMDASYDIFNGSCISYVAFTNHILSLIDYYIYTTTHL